MHVVMLPIYKPIVPSMWAVLLTVGQFVIWREIACTPQGLRRAQEMTSRHHRCPSTS